MLTFTVHMQVAGKGSRSVGRAKSGRAFTRPDNPAQKPFAEVVARAAVEAGATLEDGQFGLSVVWYAPRPASHLTASGKPRKGAPARPGVADGDKVLRNIADALEGIVWRNDRAVRPAAIDCHFGSPQRCEVTVFRCPPAGRWVYQEDRP